MEDEDFNGNANGFGFVLAIICMLLSTNGPF